MAKKSVSVQGLMALMVIVLLSVIGLVAYLVIDPAAGDAVRGGIPVSTGNCPDTLATSFAADCMNTLNASSSQYIACALKLVPDNDFSQFIAYTAAATSSRTTAINLRCGHNYVAYGSATIDAVNSFEPVSMGLVSGQSEARVFQGTKFSAMKANAYDNLNRAFVYDSSHDGDRTDQESLAVQFDSTVANGTATAMGVGGILDWSYTLSTTDSIGQFGNKDVGIYVAVDADKTDYEEPSIYFDGSLLTDIKGTGEVSSDDEATLSAYEYIYKISGDIKVQPRTIRMVTQGKSGVDPDVDTVLRFCAKGYYFASDGFTLKKDCFNEATAAEIATATVHTITNDIS